MAIRDSLLPEFDHEMETTRKTLERVPEDKTNWKPHDSSMAMGRLAGHIAEMAGFAATTFKGDSFDFAPPGGTPTQPTMMTSRKQLWTYSIRTWRRRARHFRRPATRN